jgi:UDP-N-acetylmuramate--alanine ligase
MRAMTPDIGVLHFIGIGGIGMSGIAEVLHELGYKIQGSDQADSANVKRLKAKGIRIMVGHKADNIKDEKGNNPAAVVYSSAVKNNNPELSKARELKLPVVRRAAMLAELMRLKSSVAVGGTHGKTTTTSMVGEMLGTAGFDPTVINGGIVNAYGTNTRMGKSEWMVVEADESDGTFTRLPATVAVVTNMDPEHMEHYGDFENVKKAYLQFVKNVPFYGYAVLCIDHPAVQALIPDVGDRKIITYGFSSQADVQATNVKTGPDGSNFDVVFLNGGKEKTLRDVHLSMPGRHNVQNALVSLAIAREMGVPDATMKKALSNFAGVKRRFTKTGEAGGITVIDDYGHHPVEIETVLKTARTVAGKGKVIAVMQPHRFTRLNDLFEDFCKCFNDADSVIVADVYAAGEDVIEGMNKERLIQGLKDHGHRDVTALNDKSELPALAARIARPGDYIICLGAGDITYWAYDLPAQLGAQLQKSRGSAA